MAVSWNEVSGDEPVGRPTWAEVDLGNLCHNYRQVRRRLAPGSTLMAVVKADAYGHGAVRCAQALASAGADWFGVALPEEGHELRAAGIGGRIFCLGGFWRGQARRLIADEITPAIFRPDMAAELEAGARDAGRAVECHLKVDTGMGRLGVRWDELTGLAQYLKGFDRLRVTGLLTHFADADGHSSDFTRTQIARFDEAYRTLVALGFDIRWRHLANSAGIHGYPEAPGTLARAGATLYGLVRDVLAPDTPPADLRPVMSLHSRIILIKQVPAGTPIGYGRSFTTRRTSLVATIPVGYADGVPRALSNRGWVLVQGRRAPIIGRVSMDLTIVDVTDLPAIQVGDEVLILGARDGQSILAEDIAAVAGTISYEIVTGISRRVPRRCRQP